MMFGALSLLDFRFAIGEPGKRQSSIWHAWSYNSDVYASFGDCHKLSVHASAPYYFYGLTGEYAKRHLGGQRNLTKWLRGALPRPGEGRAARIVWAVFPTDYLGPDRREYHGVHWIPAAPAGQAVQIDIILTLEGRTTVEAAFKSNGRRLEEYVTLPNGQAFAIVSSIMSDWENKDVLLRGGPDFSNVAFLAEDEKGSDRSEILCFWPEPKDGGPLKIQERWGNHVPKDFLVPSTMLVITGGPNGVRGHRKPFERRWRPPSA
jgi:hypothetical protein